MNLCTDQLAMMLADEGQLYSVSYISQDPGSSSMHEEARQYLPNHGRAEEIFLMNPDLVIAGSYSSPATLSMLRRLDVPVVVMDPANTLDDVRARLSEMGEILHRQDAAQAAIDAFDARLAALSETVTDRPRAALYAANGWASGTLTLPGQIVAAAGFDNVADERGLSWGGFLPLELLAMSDPDAVISSQTYAAASRAEEILLHPVVEHLRQGRITGAVTDTDWVCGTPYVLNAIEALADRRRAAGKGPQ